MAHKKVLFVVAHNGYHPVEYLIPKKTLEHAGFKVITASNVIGNATAKDKSTTIATEEIKDVDVMEYEAIVFIGGPGAMDNLDNQDSYTLINEAVGAEKLVCAICIAPRILANAGVLNLVSATGWDGDGQLQSIFDEYDVYYVKAPVVTDQGFITATGPEAAQDFADEILAQLKTKE
jgi:protease I